jgi:hypothetical protein
MEVNGNIIFEVSTKAVWIPIGNSLDPGVGDVGVPTGVYQE